MKIQKYLNSTEASCLVTDDDDDDDSDNSESQKISAADPSIIEITNSIESIKLSTKKPTIAAFKSNLPFKHLSILNNQCNEYKNFKSSLTPIQQEKLTPLPVSKKVEDSSSMIKLEKNKLIETPQKTAYTPSKKNLKNILNRENSLPLTPTINMKTPLKLNATPTKASNTSIRKVYSNNNSIKIRVSYDNEKASDNSPLKDEESNIYFLAENKITQTSFTSLDCISPDRFIKVFVNVKLIFCLN